MAKKSANSWDKQDDVEAFSEMESCASEIIQRTQMEQWGVNVNVHYNAWKDFSKEDFQPIKDAFQDMENMYRCLECQGIIGLKMDGLTPSNLKCPCGNISWNL